MIDFKPGDALLIVDIQNDFLPGGSLGVPEGDQIITPINNDIKAALQAKIPIFASRDWHPANHISFVERGGLWPPHCIQNSKGAEFHQDLQLPEATIIINKAFTPDFETYSVMRGESISGQPFPDLLKELGIKRLFVGGLCLDYCVVETALDAAKAGISVWVLLDATRAITPETGKSAIDRMNAAGIKFVLNKELSAA